MDDPTNYTSRSDMPEVVSTGDDGGTFAQFDSWPTVCILSGDHVPADRDEVVSCYHDYLSARMLFGRILGRLSAMHYEFKEGNSER
jgi:hypothetical protein